jgi:transposase
MRPLSEDLRRRIVAAREGGAGTGEVCQRFSISRSSAERFWNQYRLSGHLKAKQIGGYRISRLAKHGSTLKRWIAQKSDITLAQMRERLKEQFGIRIANTALWHQLDQLGLSYKKNDARRRARQA